MAQIPVYLDDELKEMIQQVAARQERSVSFLIRRWIKEGLDRLNQAQLEVKTESAANKHRSQIK